MSESLSDRMGAAACVGRESHRSRARRARTTFRREFDAAYAAGGIFQLTCHPHIIGYRSRIWILDELLRHAKGNGSVWFATHAEIAAWAKLHGA